MMNIEASRACVRNDCNILQKCFRFKNITTVSFTYQWRLTKDNSEEHGTMDTIYISFSSSLEFDVQSRLFVDPRFVTEEVKSLL